MHNSAKVQKTDFSPIMAKFAPHEKPENILDDIPSVGDALLLSRTGLRTDRFPLPFHHRYPATIGSRFLYCGQNLLLSRSFKRVNNRYGGQCS